MLGRHASAVAAGGTVQRRGHAGGKLRVLFLVPDLEVTSPLSVHADLMRFLRREEVEVHAVHPRLAAQPGRRELPGSVFARLGELPTVRLTSVSFGPSRGTGGATEISEWARATIDVRHLVQYVRRERIDVIHCDYRVASALYAYGLARSTRAKYIIHMHSNYGSWLKPPSVFAFNRAAAIITVSRWVARTVTERGGIPAERVVPVLNGIDPARWDPTINGEPVRREFGLSAGDPLIVQLAQLVHWKRQDMMIRAFAPVIDRHPRARLLLVGEESPPPGFEARLRRQVAEAGLERHVVFTGRRHDIRQILASAEVMALPSKADPCPLAVAEAMAMGKPVVSVRSGGIPEVLEHGKAGLLGAEDDADQLAANLVTMIERPALREAMGQHGRRRVLEYFNAQRMADEVAAVYRRVAASRRRAENF